MADIFSFYLMLKRGKIDSDPLTIQHATTFATVIEVFPLEFFRFGTSKVTVAKPVSGCK